MSKSKILKVKSGDILAIPTIKRGILGYVLARVIEEKKSTLIEVFDVFYDDFNIDKQVLAHKVFKKSDRLFSLIKVALLFEDSKGADKWKIVSHSENFNADVAKEGVVFIHPDYEELGFYYENGEEKKDPPESRNRNKSAEDTIIYQTAQTVFRVKLYMDRIFRKGEIFNSTAVFGKYHKKGVFKNMLDEAVNTSIAVAKEFERNE